MVAKDEMLNEFDVPGDNVATTIIQRTRRILLLPPALGVPEYGELMYLLRHQVSGFPLDSFDCYVNPYDFPTFAQREGSWYTRCNQIAHWTANAHQCGGCTASNRQGRY